MSMTLDFKYYKIEVNDESKETKCTQIIICETSTQAKEKHCLNFETNIEFLFHILKLKGITKVNMIT